MDQPVRNNRLASLQLSEHILEFLHRNGVDMSDKYAVSAYLELYRQKHGLTEIPSLALQFASTHKYRESDSHAFFSDGRRLGVFQHPRFVAFDVHSHGHFEFKYISSGQAVLTVAGHHLELSCGDLCLIAPGVEHAVSIFDHSVSLINIVLPPASIFTALPRICNFTNPFSNFIFGSFNAADHQPLLLCHTGDNESLRPLITRAQALDQTSTDQLSFMLIEALIEEFLLAVLSDHSDGFESNRAASPPKNLLPILRHIMENSTNLTLPELAKLFNYSEAHLSRLIKKYTGQTFSSLIQERRISHAAELLQTSNLSVSEIMLQVGYTGKSNFYRVFQHMYGCTPDQFRKRKSPYF